MAETENLNHDVIAGLVFQCSSHEGRLDLVKKVFEFLKYQVHTALLFTWSDYKTIFLPITFFACSTAPVYSISRFVQGELWIWIHLLLCNVSNQAGSETEDAVNRPWRPLPSKRVSRKQAVILRWTLVVLCMVWSATYDAEMALITLGLFVTTYVYDEGGLAAHPVGKNLCNIGGYTTFELGATKLMDADLTLDSTSLAAVALSGILIFTTIQAQDFPDVEGDSALGRITFPVYAPEFSRLFTLVAMNVWPFFLSNFWDIGNVCEVVFVTFGAYVGWRYYLWRDTKKDKTSYLLFNGWLMFAHILPIHARLGVLLF
ncbi:hypothetical protein VKT23_014906 [Stygiomarasmius scandens]|uniref:Uncharacterized protein n=1 Tax=Marasmiellus scandens TaxID=2682957 RepID=A0ABR1IZF5_9AGAR